MLTVFFLNLILLILKLYDLKEDWRPFWLYLIKTKQKVNQILSYWIFLMVLGSRGHMFSFNNSNPLRELSVPDNYKSAKYQISPNSLNLKPYTWNRHLYSIRTKLLCSISGWCLTNSTAIVQTQKVLVIHFSSHVNSVNTFIRIPVFVIIEISQSHLAHSIYIWR